MPWLNKTIGSRRRKPGGAHACTLRSAPRPRPTHPWARVARRSVADLVCLTVPRTVRIIWVCRRSISLGKEPPLMRTFVASAKSVDSRWHVIDAEGPGARPGGHARGAPAPGQAQGRSIRPFIDTGDHVVIVNAGAVKLTGRKEEQKLYRRHSGYEGGLARRAREDRAASASRPASSKRPCAACCRRPRWATRCTAS